jgi:hypothetical protein
MSQAVHLSDELIDDARTTAARAERSIASQIEFWARIGRAFEPLVDRVGLSTTNAEPPLRCPSALRLLILLKGASDLRSTSIQRHSRTMSQFLEWSVC